MGEVQYKEEVYIYLRALQLYVDLYCPERLLSPQWVSDKSYPTGTLVCCIYPFPLP